MPPVNLTDGHLGRPRLSLPAVRMVNAYLEASPGGPSQAVRTSRPGLTRQFTIGTGPILRQFQKPGLFGSGVFSISGGELYLNQTLLGSVSYSNAPRFAAAQQYIAIVVGGALYIYDGTTFRLQEFFDDGYSLLPPFSCVTVLYNIWIYTVAGSNEFYFSAVGNPASINAGNFGAAQVSPTPTVETAVLAEEVYFFKTDTVEIWDYSGSLTAPFSESPGRTYARGCAAQNSVTLTDNSLFWVGDDFTVYRTSTVPERISTSLIEDRLKADGDTISRMTALTFNMEGHVFYVMNLIGIGESYAYDCQTKQWFRWGTLTGIDQDPQLFLANTAAGQGQQVYAGSAVDGRVFIVDPNNHSDDGTHLRVILSGALWINEDNQRANNLALQMVRGVATVDIPDPKVWMRWSDDGAQTWTSWLEGSIGPVGGYRYKVSWHSLGLISQPGREFEFYISDGVNVTIESVTMNPARR